MRHRRNPMRQFMPMKPNKWGTKFYMTCCAETAYCSRYGICFTTDDPEYVPDVTDCIPDDTYYNVFVGA